jgi:hypothetical protein
MKIDFVKLGQTELRSVSPPVAKASLKPHCAAPGQVSQLEALRRDAPAVGMVAG